MAGTDRPGKGPKDLLEEVLGTSQTLKTPPFPCKGRTLFPALKGAWLGVLFGHLWWPFGPPLRHLGPLGGQDLARPKAYAEAKSAGLSGLRSAW